MTHYTTQTTEIIQTTKDYNQTTTRRQSLTKAKKNYFFNQAMSRSHNQLDFIPLESLNHEMNSNMSNYIANKTHH